MTIARYITFGLMIAAFLLQSFILTCVVIVLGICCFINADFELFGP